MIRFHVGAKCPSLFRPERSRKSFEGTHQALPSKIFGSEMTGGK